jgi:hypothetical protein
MGDGDKPIEERLGQQWAYLTPWSSDPIDMSLDQVEDLLREDSEVYGYKARIYRPPDSNQVWFTVIREIYPDDAFTLILTPNGNSTTVSMNELPKRLFYYFLRFRPIEKRLGLHINAPRIYEDDSDFVAAGSPPAPKPKKMSAKKFLAEYRRRKRKSPKLTLKAFCEQTGYKYESIKTAKWRIDKGKKERAKS